MLPLQTDGGGGAARGGLGLPRALVLVLQLHPAFGQGSGAPCPTTGKAERETRSAPCCHCLHSIALT